MPGQHGMSLKDYTQALTIQLRLREIPGTAIGQIVAEVESHVRETGEDPVEAFGQPGSYSAQFAEGRRPGPRRGLPTLLLVVATALAAVGALMLLEGVFSLTGVVGVTANMILAWVAVGLMYALVVRRLDLTMADRETRTVIEGRRVQGSRAAYWVHLLALSGALLAGQAILSLAPQGPVLLHTPGWVLALVGVALTTPYLWRLRSRSDPIVDPRRW
jgi:uncharacterized membrane-anchored protein